MSSRLPPSGTYQPEKPSTLRPGNNRARRDSATAEKYRPRKDSHSSPRQPDPRLRGPHQHSYAPPDPSIYPTERRRQPPYPQNTGSPNGPIPMPQPAPVPSHPNPPRATLRPSSRHNSYTEARPPPEDDYGRRLSHSSQRSHRSHRSHGSHDSRHSHGSKRSRHSRHSADERHQGRPHHDRPKRDHPKRTNERPTLGDSLVSMFDLIKSALGPRDR